MYIIERLKQDFPQYIKDINEFELFITKYHNDNWNYKIFDDSKEFYKFIEEAYKIGPGNQGYNRAMCHYEQALNYDIDFLQFFIQEMFNDNTDYSRKTVLELRNIIDKHYKNKGHNSDT